MEIASTIASNPDIKLILIAGPSSSGFFYLFVITIIKLPE
jgi:hypothetical protein